MIDKIIIAEDQETANLSVQKTIEEMQIDKIDYAFYCDHALSRIQMAKQRGEPYDLLITDLYFEPDGSPQEINDGFELIASARAIQPELLVLVFSAEKRPEAIDKLVKELAVDAYVRKARNDAKELKAALQALSKGQRFYSQDLARLMKQSTTYEFNDFDIQILQLISKGYHQNEIPAYLKSIDAKPSSLSSVEKRLNQIREKLGFSKNEQLILFCREKGIL